MSNRLSINCAFELHDDGDVTITDVDGDQVVLNPAEIAVLAVWLEDSCPEADLSEIDCPDEEDCCSAFLDQTCDTIYGSKTIREMIDDLEGCSAPECQVCEKFQEVIAAAEAEQTVSDGLSNDCREEYEKGLALRVLACGCRNDRTDCPECTESLRILKEAGWKVSGHLVC